jgi:hypothetical protein
MALLQKFHQEVLKINYFTKSELETLLEGLTLLMSFKEAFLNDYLAIEKKLKYIIDNYTNWAST